jgi:hypothetical protein
MCTSFTTLYMLNVKQAPTGSVYCFVISGWCTLPCNVAHTNSCGAAFTVCCEANRQALTVNRATPMC